MNFLFSLGKKAALKMAKGKIDNKKLIAGASILGLALLFVGPLLFILMAIAPAAVVLSAVTSFANAIGDFFEKTGNLLVGRGFQIVDEEAVNEKEKEFGKAINDKYLAYLTKGVEIDAALVTATVYFPISMSYDENVVICMNNVGAPEQVEAACEEADLPLSAQYDLWKEKKNRLPALISHSLTMIKTEYNCEAIEDEATGETYYFAGDPTGKTDTQYPAPEGDPKQDETCTGSGTIWKYTYEANVEGYDQYLKDEYIIDSKEYGFDPDDYSDEQREKELNKTVDEIHDLAKMYKDLFSPPVIAQQVYGAIPYNILTQMIVPVGTGLGADGKNNYRISSCFQPYRQLSNGVSRAHNGIDLNVRNNDGVVKAAAAGTIISASNSNNFNCYDTQCEGQDGRGNYVTIAHIIDGISFTTEYFHLSSVSVSTGDVVTAGQAIGQIGNTGHSSGTHLHFQYKDSSGTPVNPGNLFTNPYEISSTSGCGVLSVDCANKNSPVAISPIYGKWGSKTYPISVKVNGLAPIPLEQYILGVALNEMPASYNLEAIKAQFITARTYTFGSQRFLAFELQESLGQIVIDMGAASESTQTFNLNRICQLDTTNQSKMIQALEFTRGQVLLADATKKMFSTEYSSCAKAVKGASGLWINQNYVCKLPECVETVTAYCNRTSCTNSDGRNTCGHGRGMSQDGADYLADNMGYTTNQILEYYYNAQISDLGSIDLSGYERGY